MKNSSYVAIGAIIVLLILLIWGVIYSLNHPHSVVKNSTSTTTSLRKLLENKNSKCTFKSATAEVKGNFYFGDGQMRGDIKVTTQNNSYETHIIGTSDKVYLWTGTDGVVVSKMEFQNAHQAPDAPLNLDQKILAQCSTWTPEQTKFQSPVGIIFRPLTFRSLNPNPSL